jgi:hypothetical protein
MTKTLLEEEDTLRHLIVYDESGFPDEDEWERLGEAIPDEGDDDAG